MQIARGLLHAHTHIHTHMCTQCEVACEAHLSKLCSLGSTCVAAFLSVGQMTTDVRGVNLQLTEQQVLIKTLQSFKLVSNILNVSVWICIVQRSHMRYSAH